MHLKEPGCPLAEGHSGPVTTDAYILPRLPQLKNVWLEGAGVLETRLGIRLTAKALCATHDQTHESTGEFYTSIYPATTIDMPPPSI
jgi:hypothetical protein